MNIIRIESVTSTNNYLQEIAAAKNVEEGTVVITQYQVAGRGQQGNGWESESGKNLTFSIILYPHKLPINQNFLISQITALAVKDTLEEFTTDISVKWPNDIYYKDKKICGILIENNLTGDEFSQSIIGIGVNINQEIFRSKAPNPVSLKQITGVETDLDLLLEKMVSGLLSKYHSALSGNSERIISDYHHSLYRKNGFHHFSDKNGDFTAQIIRVEDNGLLVLSTMKGKEQKYTFKGIKYAI